MSKIKVPDRTPFPEDKVSGFAMMVNILARQMGIDEQRSIFHYVELLSDACDRHSFEQDHQVSPKKKMDKERKRFIAVFKSRYLQFLDYEYDQTITGVDGRMIQQAIISLEKDSFTVDELLEWAFDVFYVENPKFCPPNIKQACSALVIQAFRYRNRDRMQKKHREALQRKEGMSLIGRGRTLLREAKRAGLKKEHQNVKKSISEFGTQSIMLGAFRTLIEKFEKDSDSWITDKSIGG